MKDWIAFYTAWFKGGKWMLVGIVVAVVLLMAMCGSAVAGEKSAKRWSLTLEEKIEQPCASERDCWKQADMILLEHKPVQKDVKLCTRVDDEGGYSFECHKCTVRIDEFGEIRECEPSHSGGGGG